MYSGQEQPPQPPAYMPPAQRVKFEFIGEAFQLLQKQLGTWVATALISVTAIGLTLAPFYGMLVALLLRRGEGMNPGALIGSLLVGVLGMILLSGLISGGLQSMALKQLRGQTLRVSDLFGTFSHLGPVLALMSCIGLVSGLVSGILDAVLKQILGDFSSLVSSLPGAILQALFCLALPLVLDQKLSPIAAMNESVRLIKSELWIAVAFVLVTTIISFAGFFACGLGVLFTMPLHAICIALLYRSFFPERFSQSETQESP